jgi:hypothetical protein
MLNTDPSVKAPLLIWTVATILHGDLRTLPMLCRRRSVRQPTQLEQPLNDARSVIAGDPRSGH